MPKLQPEERWKRHILERFSAFKLSGQLKKLRAKGLTILRRRKLLTPEEWYQSASDQMSSKKYSEFYAECSKVAARFGLAPWTIEMACLLKGYSPEKQIHVMEAKWPQVKIVTEITDPVFLTRLAYEAQRLGMYVLQREGSVENTYIFLHSVPLAAVDPPPMPSVLPPTHSAIQIRVEIPPEYPPEAASTLIKKAEKLGRKLKRSLGYPTNKRLRSSPLVSMADELRISETKLPRRTLYEIVAETYEEGDGDEDERRKNIVKTRRHRIRKRLVEPYENGESKKFREQK